MTRDDKLAIISLVVFVAAGAAWFYHQLQSDRYKVQSFCSPRGYISGFIRKDHSLWCVARNGRHVLIRDIERVERNAK